MGIVLRRTVVTRNVHEELLAPVYALFRNGEEGVLYDYNDPATMSQDLQGSVPAALEMPVALIRDKRFGLALEPESLLDDTFDVPASWTSSVVAPATASVSGGQARIVSPAGESAALYQASRAVVGKTYDVAVDVAAYSGSAALYFSGSAAWVVPPGVGVKKFLVVADGISPGLKRATPGLACDITVNGMSVREMRGNHSTILNAASRPVLTARRNVLRSTNGTNIGSPGWSGFRLTSVQQPDGSYLVSRTSTTENCYTIQMMTYPVGTDLVLQLKVKQGTVGGRYGIRIQGAYPDRGDLVVNLANGSIAYSAAVGFTDLVTACTPLGAGWYLMVLKVRVANSPVSLVSHGPTTIASGAWEGASVELANAFFKEPQMELGTIANRYQWVGDVATTPAAYDTVGFPKGLRWDGVDDWAVSSTLQLGGATQLLMVSSNMKNGAQATYGAVAEYGVGGAGNQGVVGMFAQDASKYHLNGALQAGVSGDLATFRPGVPRVVTGIWDSDGATREEELIGRVDGQQLEFVAGVPGPMGSGAFGNYPLYQGRRGGTSLPLNATTFGLLFRAGPATLQQVQAVEALMAHAAAVD